MNPGRWSLYLLTTLMPVAIEVQNHGDSTTTVVTSDGTRVEVMGGAGEYAFITRGCDNQIISEVPVSFREAGGAIEHRLGRGPVSVGVRGGVMHDDIADASRIGTVEPTEPAPSGSQRVQIDNRYVNPYVTIESARVSAGVGWVAHDKEFIVARDGESAQSDHSLKDMSFHVRIGSEHQYFAVRRMESVPLYSGGGYFTMGLGGRGRTSPLSVFIGLGADGPYEGAGLALQGGYRLRNGMSIKTRGRLGFSGNSDASGVSIGVGYGEMRP